MTLAIIPSDNPQRTFADYVSTLFLNRKNEMAAEFQRMREIQEVINGNIDLPTTELSDNEKSAAPNLSKVAMQQLARRMVSVSPSLTFPALSETDDERADAQKRTRIVKSWHEETYLGAVQAQRARWFLAYSKGPVLVYPNQETSTPYWKPIHPMKLYYAPLEYGQMIPSDVVIESTQTLGWLMHFYPEAAQNLRLSSSSYQNGNLDEDAEICLLRYISEHHDFLIVKGQDEDGYANTVSGGYSPAEVLVPARNLAGCPLVVIPSAISLDYPQGQFDDIIGMYQAQSKLIALQMIAQERAIFPREWMEANPGEEPVVAEIPQPKDGIPGRIRGGRITQQKIDPSQQTLELGDRLEYASRMTAGIPPEFGGQGATNVRTARRGGQVIGQTVDFTIAEGQDLFAKSNYHENCIAIELDKAYWPKTKSYFISSPAFNGTVQYKPGNLWRSHKHVVRYPLSGTDAETLVLTTSQRIASGMMSQDTAMSIDPLIEDAPLEKKKIQLESVMRGLMASLEAQAQNPEGPYSPLGYADLYKKMMVEGLDLEDALLLQQKEAQQRQQAIAEQQSPTTNPGMALPGEAAPGVETAAIPEVQPSQQHLSQLLGSLYSTQAATKSRAPTQGGGGQSY